ncbi:RYamide receptor [Anopheles stephensi]|uniref:G-protein coupled receptors family 1 profile domain-containing protein n=1 Tax=Anopheles stephensi TaxID=30069 RepID=A0A182YMH7_ANOST|nr:RYamide receptor [Anopheles stephensi]
MQATDITAYHTAYNYTLNQSDVRIVLEDENLYKVPIGLLVLLSIFYGTISILAVIGNSLVIWIVITTKQMQTITNMFIANLALADVTIGVFAIPFQFQAALLQRWNLPEFMCPFCPFVQLISVNVSVFTLTAIAVDRHRAIINPLRARTSKNISKFVISSIWMLSFVLAAPILFALRVRPVSYIALGGMNDTYTNITVPFCKVVNFEDGEILLYRYVLVLVQYFIPLFVISFVYIQMALRLWGSKTPGNAQDSRDITMLKNKKKVIKMLIIVVALFGVCWFPLQLYNILHVTWPEINEYRFINIIWFVCDWLAMSNSCYNPFIYGIYNEKFKREFRKRYPFKRDQTYNHNHESDKTSSIFTRVSSIRSTYATSSIRNKLSTNRYSASKQFKFPPPNHHFQHQPGGHHNATGGAHLHELAFGTSKKGPVNFDGTVTTTFATSHPREKKMDHRLVEHDQLIASCIERLDHELACSSTVDSSEDHRNGEPRMLNRPDIDGNGTGRAAKLRNGSSRECGLSIASNYADRMALKHPHPDSGGESGDGEPKPGQRSSEERDSGGHLYCNDLEELGPYYD